MASKEPAAPGKKAREEKPSFHAVLNEFLRRNRILFIALLAVLLTAIVVAAVWTTVDARITSSATMALEQAEKSLGEWRKAETAADARSKADEILAELDAVASKYGRRYPAQKALLLSGRIYADLGDWTAAEKKFTEAADRKGDSFLASLALQEAAVAAEERKDGAAAIALWNRVIETSPPSIVGLPHAYFALGSLYEESSQYAEAKERYDKLIATYPDNDWTKLARNRIIFLKSQGLLP